MPSSPCVQRFFCKIKLAETLLRNQLTQTNLESRFHIATGSPKEFFNDTVNILWIN